MLPTVRLLSPLFLTHLIWPAVISSGSWERNHSYKGAISRLPHDIQEQLLAILSSIPESQFQWSFQLWEKAWFLAINSEGDCFELDSNNH